MRSDDDDIWYRMGYALERLRGAPARVPSLETLKETERAGKTDDDGAAASTIFDAAASTVRDRLLSALPLRKKTGLVDLVIAAATGAGAAVVTEAVASFLVDRRSPLPEPEELGKLLATGAGRGVTYAGVVEPRVPGPAFVAGFLYGTVEYLTASWGGLSRLLGPISPHRKVPVLADALESDRRDETAYLEHLAYALALALLYDALRRKSGITHEE